MLSTAVKKLWKILLLSRSIDPKVNIQNKKKKRGFGVGVYSWRNALMAFPAADLETIFEFDFILFYNSGLSLERGRTQSRFCHQTHTLEHN